jgi:hypothetical protein
MMLVPVGDVELCVDVVGDPACPVVVLISEAGASMDWWPRDLCPAARSVTAGSTWSGSRWAAGSPRLWRCGTSSWSPASRSSPPRPSAASGSWYRDHVIDWFLDSERAFAGQLGVDVAAVRSSAGSAFDRSQDLAAAGNRWLVVGQGGGPTAPR